MKKVFVSFLIACTAGTASAGFANGRLSSSVAETVPFQSAVYVLAESTKLDVIVGKVEHAGLIRFLDAQGKTLASQRVGKSGKATRARFDLSNLEDGVYRVEITDGYYTQVKEVQLGTPALLRSLAVR